ncbi:VCBS domain-containing protein [Bradyrhizobium japonicum]|uniref:VCBS domain-containing protein n=1 Tax=Bradyrhizobium japonicum TaxID=375 RepID=UPI0020A20AEF|nr:VCBS domain-containing protein [Bradyrhizobium japonicum]MCP1760313.1 VCBS repeat-containing protein [Bradyrhizobium japonicum]MCP1791904.1 VCBS repeat-containing protein [Bradyrhizobium japonicum]MCP1804326.1 VCBS repeat-containing protein [Bradyrhizobium japonicum]MCP1813348.1 VCBS repeat-containing protein [Bradyrhizobium japonicum]MCP1875231.1 VCBS repeat-containing protein [Bradyrhizobium japonicum]
MNYAGKFDATIPLDGEGSRSAADILVDSFTAKPFIAKPFVAKAHGHVPDGTFVVPDANLIFNGEFKRAGLDLVLSHEGHEFVVHDYFKGDKRAAIASPDGAHLTGDVVNALTGHVQYAQAAPGIAAAQVIGHVTKLSGSATAVRNGVSVTLNNGDNVEKGDVVSTGADSTLGITFIDGTVFGLSSNARMVLNEMVYDPNGSSNSSLLSLVAGTITFVAGETAKHGDMKIDTPVATMGIRGTAVLTQINFVVPAGGGDPQPQASFQVLVEPNGTTGSYILFDKVTLLPIATVNQAGQMIQISGGNVSITNGLLSPDVQKLITDVFTLKFTDNNTNTKLTTNFTDTITQTSDGLVIKTPAGYVATAFFVNLSQQGSQGSGDHTAPFNRYPGKPLSQSLDLNGNVKTAFALTERADTTGDATHSDTISGRITFVDQNLGDRPTVSINLAEAPNYVYKSAGQDVTGTLSALQKQDIAATQIQISVVADAGNNNNGSAVWTYTVPDHVFDFLAAGETLTLTYMVRVDNNFSVSPETTVIPITITITGTNDKPVITTSVPTITFEGGTSVPGGPLTSDVPTTGTLSFDDVDLTDKHTVSVALTSATLPDGTVPPGPLAAFQSAMSVAIAAGADSTGDGTGTINWSLADLPVYLADFIPKGEVLTLVYTVTLTDSQGATSQQTITVTITGTDAPAVVWIATDKAGAPSGGFWKDAANWATGTVPTINDDVIVITDQLHGLTPSYPVTIDTAAYAKSLTMNDFGGPPPKVIVQNSLTISGALNMGADSILTTAATGTMSVGGKAEILGTSVLTNAGYLTLAGGGDFASGTTITNSGTIELSGGTLKTLATIHNAGGLLRADAGATLIVDTATVDGGTVSILGTLELDGASLIENGTLNNSGTVNVKGAVEFAHETVSNTAAGVIEVLANGWLTIHQGSSVINDGQIMVDASGKLIVSNATIDGAGAVIGTIGGDDEGGPVLNAGIRGAGTITNNGEIDLTGDAVLSGGILNNNAVVKASGARNALSNETVINAGIIEVLANGALAIDQGSTVDNSAGDVIVDGNAVLTLDDATISGGAIKGAGTIDVTGASKIDNGAMVSISALTVEGDVTLTLDDATVSGTAIVNHGTVNVDAGKTLTLNGASLAGGTLTIAGTLESTGASAIDNSDVDNTGTISVTSGTLTIDPGILHAITNHGLIEAVTGGTLKLTAATVANAGGIISVDGASKLYLTDVSINGGSVTNAGNLYSVAGLNTITGGVTNTGTIEVQSGTLNLSGGITGAGTLIIDDNTTLELGGADAQTVTFTGGTNTLELDKTSHGFTGTIAGQATTGGTFTVTGDADINSGKGDALDFTASGGTIGHRGNIILTPSGTLTGATNGIVVTQNGIGDVSLTTSGDITGQTGNGIVLHGGANGAGDITATIGGGVSGAVGLDIVSHGNGAVTVTNNGHITGTTSFGINVDQDDAGATGSTHITNTGSVAGADGVAAISIQENGTGTATIDNSGTIGTADAGSVTSSTYAIVETGGEITINNTGHINGDISVATATFNNNAGGTWTVAGSGVFGDASSIVNHGDIDLHGASISGTGLSIANYATIDSWGTASISGTITNTGTIEVHGGDLTLFGSLSGTGSVTVDAGALLTLEGTVSQTITLADDGAHLQIDTSTFGGSIAALSATDTIDLSTIKYGSDTSAVYVANADPATGGVLTVTGDDGQSISLKLTGADYSHAHFAGSDDGTGHTLITINADDDAPTFTTTDAAQLTASFSEQPDTTGASTLDPSPAATGSIDFKDIDLTDRPTAEITGQSVTWFDTDGTTHLALTGQEAALEHALTLLPQTGNKNNGAIGWSYSVADGALDFLGKDQTAKIVSTITLDDHEGQKTTAEVTITITGTNDAPVINTDQISVTQEGNKVFVHGLSVTDVDAGAHETFTLAATAASGSCVDPPSAGDTLADVNSALQALAYAEPNGPATDQVAVTVTDGHGASDKVNLIFNLTGEGPVTLAGTADKDVFFGTGYQDQFVFAAGSNHDTMLNFTSGMDKIDLAAVVTTSDPQSWINQHVTASGAADTLITINATDSILLKGVAHVQASDFIVHA